ncbi:MAG: TadE family protein [Lachnospiraceae bacterium]
MNIDKKESLKTGNIKSSGKTQDNEDPHLLDGTYTIEASFIVPIIIMLLFSVIGISFYFHDLLLADAWAAHLSEEGRMAVIYGRVPFCCNIWEDGFRDEDFEDLTVEMLEQSSTNCNDSTWCFDAEADETDIEEDEVYISLTCKWEAWDIFPESDVIHNKSVNQSREIINPQSTARNTTFVYRLIRILTD